MLRFITAAALAVCLPAVAAAQVENPVRWSVALKDPQPVKSGSRIEVALSATIEPGWHLYATTQPPGGPVATQISLPKGQPFELAAAADGPLPRTAYDNNFSMETEFYDSDVVFRVPVLVSPSTPSGIHRLSVHARFQACDEHFCLPPRTEKLEIAVRVVGLAAAPGASAPTATPPEVPAPPAPIPVPPQVAVPSASTAAPAPPPAETAPIEPVVFDHQQPATLVGLVLLAMTLGAITLLTPCVFPMVPITVSYFAARAGRSRGRAVGQAVVYCAGIILSFTALGMALALILGASGLNQFAANPWVNLLVAAIFLGFAASLFGRFELAVPARVLTALDRVSRRGDGGGTVATLLMGLTFTLTSFTCTAPFVGTLLVMTAQGDWQWPMVGMLAFASVFALPFFGLALVPEALARLPRSGEWMNSVKVSMGFLEVAAAVKFLSNADLVWGWSLLSRSVVLAIWMALGIGLAVYLLRAGMTRAAGTSRWAWRTAAAVSVGITVFLSTGLLGRRLGEIEAFLPPATARGEEGLGVLRGELSWIVNDYEGALDAARRQGRRVLIDFTGYTCTNCRWMEANMFPREDVRRELERYVRVRLYTDGEGEVYERHQQFQAATFKTVALPYYAVVTPDGVPLATFAGLTRNAAQFITFLTAAP